MLDVVAQSHRVIQFPEKENEEKKNDKAYSKSSSLMSSVSNKYHKILWSVQQQSTWIKGKPIKSNASIFELIIM